MSNRIIPVHIGLPLEDQADALKYAAKHIVEADLGFMGLVTLEHFRGGGLIFQETGKNIFTTEGRALIWNTIFGSTDKPAAVYIGLFKNDVTPVAGDTAAARLGAAGTYGECQDADYHPETNRPAYTVVNTTTNEITNAAAKAVFEIQQAFTARGAFLATSQAKAATTGALIAAKRFATSRAVVADDELAITYTLTATTA